MKVNFDAPIINIVHDKPFRVVVEPEVRGEDGKLVKAAVSKDMDLRYVALESLLGFDPQARQEAADKIACYAVAMKVRKGGSIDLESEEVALIKRKLGEAYSAAIVGYAHELLEQRVVGEA